MASNFSYQPGHPHTFTVELSLLISAAISGLALAFIVFTEKGEAAIMAIVGIVFTLCLISFILLMIDPDSVRARQTDEVLKLSSQMLDSLKDGLTMESAQRICELLLPATAAIAVGITDTEKILGYAGQPYKGAVPGNEIRTTSTRETIHDGKQRILRSRQEIGLPDNETSINAVIIMPIYQGRDIKGTLKFYYKRPRKISQAQESMAQGFAQLISIQMAAIALEEQMRLSTSMELKALQAQINPHFLFNTINCIASFIRTDPAKARTLLREFAVFYRSALEDGQDLILLEREIAQVQRYFMFEVARFGEESLELVVDIDPEVGKMLVPSFIVQPLVENAVKHARPADAKLTVRITADLQDDQVVIRVIDDGVGMTEEAVNNIMHPKSSNGLGIAVKNVHDRILGYFGPESRMDVESVLGEGTTVTFLLDRKFVGTYEPVEKVEPTQIATSEKGDTNDISEDTVSSVEIVGVKSVVTVIEKPGESTADDVISIDELATSVDETHIPLNI